jgi:hypothetical protein
MNVVAGTAAARAASREQAQALIEVVDWTELEDRLRAERVLALLGDRIIATADGRAPVKFVEATGAALDAGRAQDAALELITIQLIDSLRSAGIQSLPLKGPTLGRAIHGDAGRRPSADIDLLVHREDLPGAVAVAERLGYRDQHGFAARRELPRLHVTLAREGLPPLELHWRVHWYRSRFSSDLLTRSSEAGQLGRRATQADELASLLLFYERDGFVGLRLACDLAAWWDRLGSELPPRAMEEIIAGYPELERALVAAAVVAERVVALPSCALLDREQPPERRVWLAIALANPDSRGSVKKQSGDIWLIDWLLTPRGGRRECVRRQLRAPSDSPRDGPDELASLNRGARLLRRYAFSIARVAGDQLRGQSHSVTKRS